MACAVPSEPQDVETLAQRPKLFQPLNRSIGSRAIAQFGGDVDVERKGSAPRVVIVDAGCEAL